MKKVKDVVNRNLITVSPSSSFEEVINIMKKGVGKVPVLENEKVVGIITRDDILVKEGKFPLSSCYCILGSYDNSSWK